MSPPNYRVIVLPEALDDLDRITEAIKQQSPQNALKVFNGLWTATQSLALLPRSHRIYRSARDSDRIVRALTVPPFIIYYRVIEPHKTVRVLTIRHGRRRQPRRFQ